MSRMDHAAAHERIADLVLEPARLAGLDRSGDPEDAELREHLAACDDCRADMESWRRLERAVGQALPREAAAARDAVEPIDVPPALRSRVVGAVHAAAQESAVQADAGTSAGTPVPVHDRSHGAARPRAQRLAPWLGLAASLVVILGASWVTIDQATLRAEAQREATALSELVATMDRVLAENHRIVEMRAGNGTSAGSISWSRHDWVVLTTALAEPPSEQAYKCWLENGERSILVGQMEFAGGTAYWAGSLEAWATFDITPETEFVVTLEPADGRVRTGTPVLSADLGS